MRNLTSVALAALALAACRDDRAAALESRVAELAAETERLSRDLADLRRRGGAAPASSPGAAAPATDRSAELDASLDGLFDYLSSQLPQTKSPALVGVWSSRDGGEILHLAEGGRLCGYRAKGPTDGKEPFWGTWRRRGRFLAELHDRWVGDHNEHDPVVRLVDAADAGALVLRAAAAVRFERVPPERWAKLASLYDDRAVPIPGLPKWCLAAP